MLDQVAREIAKAEDEIGKAKADMERAHSKLAKIERSLAQCRKARRWLPDVYPGWEQAEHADMSLSFDGFVRQRDRRQFEQVAAALQAGTIAKVFDTLSIVFNCDKSEICLTEERIATRNGEKMPVVYFRYVYNQAFNDVLKASGGATFNLRLKAWSVALGGNAIEYVARRIGKFYRVVIDLGRMVIMHNENVPNVAAKTRAAFNMLPFHVQIKKSEVIDAILSSRPNDHILEDRIYINNGSGFVSYPEQEVLWTRSPFLLLRYAVSSGRPRYVSLSTLGMVVEMISFGNDDKKHQCPLPDSWTRVVSWVCRHLSWSRAMS